MKLSTGTRVLIHAGLFVLLAAMFYLLMVLPAQRNLGRAREELEKATATRANAERRVALLEHDMNVLKPIPPDALTSAEMPVFLRDLSVRCRTTGAAVERIRQIPRGEAEMKSAGMVYAQKFDIGLSGQFGSLFKMLMQLEDYHKLMTTDALRFDVSRQRGEKMDIVVQATVYILDTGRRTMTNPEPVRSVP